MWLERANRRAGRHRLRAQHGRRVLGLVRRRPDQEWRSPDGEIVQIRISTESSDKILNAAVRHEQTLAHLRMPVR